MKKINFFTCSLLFAAATGFLFFFCSNKTRPASLIAVKDSDDLNAIVEKSAWVVPTERQHDWQKLEFTAFIHFGPNTFNRVEWGTGLEDPNVFQPEELDARQWVAVIKQAGMKMAMITAKHHDGFCLWPTATTEHSVASSSWLKGKGDVLRELSRAAAEEGIKLGVYLSPADLHEIERPQGSYGNGSKPRSVTIPSLPEISVKDGLTFQYDLDDYNELFMNQLYEVLTAYGPIHEIWFDGANPKPGTGQTYHYEAWYDMIRKLQPQAVIAIKGPDVRWCGNEAGNTRENEWSALPLWAHPDSNQWEDATKEDLGSRERLKNAKYLYWYPAETNTSIRHGWFYRDSSQYVKTVEELLDTWYRSVGGNTVFLLNLTPNRKGLIPPKDSSRLKELGTIIRNSFSDNLLESAEIFSPSFDKGFPPEALLDNGLENCWKGKEGENQGELVLSFKDPVKFNRVVLMEEIRRFGQRVEKFTVEVMEEGRWREITRGTVIGYKNIRRFPVTKAQKVRITMEETRAAPSLAFLGLYRAPENLSNPKIERNKEGVVKISCKTPDPVIYYTLDGTEPDENSILYNKSFILKKGTVKSRAFLKGNKKKSEIVSKKYDVSAKLWKVVETSSFHPGFGGDKAVDGLESTIWHTNWSKKGLNHPYHITIDLGEELDLKGISYMPRTDGNLTGICLKYKVETSLDGKNWVLGSSGELANIKNNPNQRNLYFKKSRKARYVKFTSLGAVNESPYCSMAELGVITESK